MTKHLLFALALFGHLASAAPAAETPRKPTTPAAPGTVTADGEKLRLVPFHGKVGAVSAASKTFTIKGRDKDRVFIVDEKSTVIGKDGAPSTLVAIPPGEQVRGSATRSGENWHVNKVTIGAKDATNTAGTGTSTPAGTPAAVKPRPGIFTAAPTDTPVSVK